MAVPIPNHPVEEKETLADLHLDWAKHLIEHATERGLDADEMFYATKARYYALQADPASALRTADEFALKMPQHIRLRTYLPALMAFVKQGVLRRDGI